MADSGTIGSGTSAGAVLYLDFLSTKGHVAPGAVAALRIAFVKVMKTVGGEEWERIEIRSVNVDDYMKRFGNMTHGQYNAKSLIDYKSRVNKVTTWYLQFLSKPGWVPPVKPRNQKKSVDSPQASVKEVSAAKDPDQTVTLVHESGPQPPKANLIAFPFPLSDGVLASLYLPTSISSSDAKRMARFIETLVVGDESDE